MEVMQARTPTVTFFLSDSGSAQRVDISIVGLPPGVWASGSRVTPPGQATLGIRVGPAAGLPGLPIAPTGTTSASVVARMNNGTEKTLPLRVTVLPNSNCGELRSGTYTSTGCYSFGNVYVTADTANITNPRIYLSNFPTSSRSGYADLNCATNTLVFPQQQYGNLLRRFSGTGTYSRDTIRGKLVIYGDASGVIVDSCEFIMGR